MSANALNDCPRAADFAAALTGGDLMILGARGSALARELADIRGRFGRPLLLVAPDPEIAEDLHNDICFHLGERGPPPLLWPAWDILPFETDHPDFEIASGQVEILRLCLEHPERVWLVAPVIGLIQPALPPERLRAGGLSIAAGDETSPEALVARLVEGGLEPVAQVDSPGQFSRRGGIVDVFPILGEVPFRIEFFGDVVETVRAFDPAIQQSGPLLDGRAMLVDVPREAFRRIQGSPHGLTDYLPSGTVVILWRPERIARVAGLYASGFSGTSPLHDFDAMAEKLSRSPLAVVPDLDGDPWPDSPWRPSSSHAEINLGAGGWERLSGGFDSAVAELGLLAARGVDLTIVCNNAGEEKRLRQVLSERAPALLGKTAIRLGRLSRGFIREEPGGGEAVVSDHELFGRVTPARPPRRRRFSGIPLSDFAELREGDYVVHVANGIARFEGMRAMEHNGANQDFLILRFADDARIYVPLGQIDLVQRYIGLGAGAPQLSKLGSAAWNRRKEEAAKAIRDVAQDLLATQARRLSASGQALPPDDPLIREFEAAFPYDETPDQVAADADIRRDQQAGSPMERLLCGDVGFGKTEMAVRAAFRVVNAGMQAAVLVPTTILAEQHCRTFSERMADYPVRVECLSRFRSPTEQAEIVEGLRNGRIDIVIGTHRLLSGDVGFRNLGLVVVDEEQKFGVEHKERLKRLKDGVDILTMTATPIPRTLHMSLLGLRDISNLAIAPRERHSVKTIVARRSWDAVRRAVLRELSRGGQCFFLHNRVHSIGELAAKLRETVPEARIGIGHGQMGEAELLEVMRGFLEGRLDVLICTTIIESGVDIPNVNTLFVNDADHFGLSELHQLRGRVGRYKHQAYAYFLVPEKRPVSPEAAKRLQALQEYAELGAGFRIALRDLEIRGAGNLLGLEQSGHIHLIGFDLYCRLLEKAVAMEKGEPLEDEVRVDLDIGSSAFLPAGYIPAEAQRIEFYRRLSRARSGDELEAARRHIRDRYGPVPAPVERCFRDQALRLRLREAGLTTLSRLDGCLRLGFADSAAGRCVSRLRRAGLKVDSLRDGLWRVDIPEAEAGLPPPELAEAWTRRVLDILENSRSITASENNEEARPHRMKPASAPAGTAVAGSVASPAPTSSTAPDRSEDRSARRKKIRPAKGKSDSVAASDSPSVPAVKARKKAKPKSIDTPAKATEPENRPVDSVGLSQPLNFFSSDMLDAPPASKTESADDDPPLLSSAAPAGDIFSELLDSTAGVRVLGIEPAIEQGQVGVVVPETAFNPIRFETMTLVVKSDPERKFHLRCVGSGVSPGRRVVLRLRASGPEEAARAAEAYLAAGAALLFDGVN